MLNHRWPRAFDIENGMKIDAKHFNSRRALHLFMIRLNKIIRPSSYCFTWEFSINTKISFFRTRNIAFECLANLLFLWACLFSCKLPAYNNNNSLVFLNFVSSHFFSFSLCSLSRAALSVQSSSSQNLFAGKCKYLICSILVDNMSQCSHRTSTYAKLYRRVHTVCSGSCGYASKSSSFETEWSSVLASAQMENLTNNY